MPKIDLPPNMRIKQLADGLNAYYWEVPTKDRKAGCTLVNEALGRDPAIAIGRAQDLNRLLADWRHRDQSRPAGPTPGTVAWLFAKVEQHAKFTAVSADTQRSYRQSFRLIENVRLRSMPFGDVPANSVGGKHADHLYQALLFVEETDPATGRVRRRRRQATANAAMRAARRAWAIGTREGWVKKRKGEEDGPFQKVELKAPESEEPELWTPAQVSAFVAQADEMDCPAMATAVLLAYHLCQRQRDAIGAPKDGRAGAGLLWSGYRATGRGAEIKLRQNKTGEWIWIPLHDAEGPLFPELTARLDMTPRRGPLIVMRDTPDRRTKQFMPYKPDHFRHVFRQIADAAGLPKRLKFKNLRHTGLTALGLAGASDRELMSISGHASPQMLARYVRRNANLAASAVRKLRVLEALDLEAEEDDDDEDAA